MLAAIREAPVHRIGSVAVALLCATVAAPAARAQAAGADVIVGDLLDTANYGSNAGIYAYAIGTVSCNIGTAQLNWIANNNQHPVIGQNLYRYFPGNAALGQYGRFEMIGMSWLKHGFTALTESLCQTCTPPGSGGTTLGIGCSDPYVAVLNGNQSSLGPRFDVNAFTGGYTYPHASPVGNATIAGRLQVAAADMNTAAVGGYPGSTFYGEAQYVTADDAAAGNHFNNVSWRPMTITGTNYTLNVSEFTRREKPAIFAWKEIDAAVSLQAIDVPGEGRFYLGYRATPLAGGMYHHEYAIFNLNSDRAAGSFTVNLPPFIAASNVGFHDVPYHSGEPWSGTDWAATATTGTNVTWACAAQAVDPNANALRWGSMYNFRFDAPYDFLGDVSLGLWKSGAPTAVAATICRTSGLPTTMTGGAYTLASSTPYDFVQTNGLAGVQTGPVGDDASQIVPLPFPFLLYDRWLSSIVISTNGYLAAPDLAGVAGISPANVTIPTTNTPNAIIAVYWDDLLVGGVNGTIDYATVGTAPNRRFVVRWKGVKRKVNLQTEDHEVILDEGTNDVTITCISTGGAGVSATRGIENSSGFNGTLISYNSSTVTAASSRKLQLTTFPSVPVSASLTFSGYGFPGAEMRWDVVSEPNAPLSLFADLVPGPLSFGVMGTLNIGLSPWMLPLADATGYWTPADPTAFTSSCNQWTKQFVVPAPGLPAGFTIYFQGLVWSPNAPNGLCHITTPVTFTS
jgi:hypothetical protein